MTCRSGTFSAGMADMVEGKSIDRTMPLGPVTVTPDELDVPNRHIELLLNDETMQSALAKQMAFPIGE
jgi:2,4-diketo-3-deoxy-L-fuconate hydrolase